MKNSTPPPTPTTHPIEQHPFGVFAFPDTQVLMMGTLPPTPDKWGMAFHYPNFYNDMWRIMGRVFFGDGEYFRAGQDKRFDADKIKAFLKTAKIGECPTVKTAIREHGNASDAHLTVVERVDLRAVLVDLPNVRWLLLTGGKACEVLFDAINAERADPTSPDFDPTAKPLKLLKTNQHITLTLFGRRLGIWRLPSSSRAYPLSLDKKVAAYRTAFLQAGLGTLITPHADVASHDSSKNNAT